jgi:hypothetical protein
MSAEAQTIPEDIMKAAEAVTKTMPQAFGWRKITIEVAKALLAERERCALIAGYYAQACLETESDGSGYYACSALVDEIRNPKPPKPPMPAIDDDYLPF